MRAVAPIAIVGTTTSRCPVAHPTTRALRVARATDGSVTAAGVRSGGARPARRSARAPGRRPADAGALRARDRGSFAGPLSVAANGGTAGVAALAARSSGGAEDRRPAAARVHAAAVVES